MEFSNSKISFITPTPIQFQFRKKLNSNSTFKILIPITIIILFVIYKTCKFLITDVNWSNVFGLMLHMQKIFPLLKNTLSTRAEDVRTQIIIYVSFGLNIAPISHHYKTFSYKIFQKMPRVKNSSVKNQKDVNSESKSGSEVTIPNPIPFPLTKTTIQFRFQFQLQYPVFNPRVQI